MAGTFTGPIQVKAHSKFRRKWSVGVSRDCPNFLGNPLLSQEQVKLRTSNFVGTFIGPIGTKAHKNVGNSDRGRSQGVPKIFRAPICRAHCAVIFAIAQLSCYNSLCLCDNTIHILINLLYNVFILSRIVSASRFVLWLCVSYAAVHAILIRCCH